jgi:hypothetical protein
MNKTTTSDVDRAINKVAAAVRSVSTGTLDAIAEDIASAKVIASFAGHPGGPVADAVDLQRHRVRKRQGTISISSYWESVIRGAFLLIVVHVQARVAKRRRR